MGMDLKRSETSTAPESSDGRESITEFVQGVSYNFFDIANAAGKFARNPQSKTALDNFFGKLRCLEKEWYDFGVKYEQVTRRNENLAVEYEREKHKARVFQKRLKFVKENQENFERLREVYESMKTLEERTVLEQETQTESDNMVPVDRDTLNEAKQTLNSIREMVSKREVRYDENAKKLAIFKERVEILETQNTQLTQLLRTKCSEEDKVRQSSLNSCSSVRAQPGKLPPRPRPVHKSSAGFKSRLKVIQIPVNEQKEAIVESDVDIPLKAIKSMKSSLTSTISRRSSHLNLSAHRESIAYKKTRTFGKGDCKEVEVLKKIRLEIEKKQQSIKDKITIFNKLLDE